MNSTAAATALAIRNAALEKAKYDLGFDIAQARGKHTLKQRATVRLVREVYEDDCARAEVKYHASRAFAQENYLVALAAIKHQPAPQPPPPPAELEWEPGLE